LLIDSRQYEISINVENIEEFSEIKEYLNLVYYLPDDKNKGKFIRKSEQFDCCENNLILKTFTGILNTIIERMGGVKKFEKRIQALRDMQNDKKKNKLF
jgi:hypothetical protein